MSDFTEFENKWIQKINNELLKEFPDDFIEGMDYNILSLPGKPLVKGSELFGTYEIIDTDGESIHSSDNPNKVKYILYSNKNYPKEIKLVSSEEELNNVVNEYEIHIDGVIKQLKDDFKSQFPNSAKAELTTNKIFRILNLHRY
jgi:hypothetical protein